MSRCTLAPRARIASPPPLSYRRLTRGEGMTKKSSKARTRLSSKGQIVLPKEIRDEQGVREGSIFEVYKIPEGILLRVAEPTTVRSSLDDLLGCAGYR